ncbi:MAG: site-specific DNA-methyltransferase [Bacteroidales bacterium]|jgi:adenine-specific DNA-methyltransferase|nr:site-specific DNA-methyltransferase [Bacteroidales bacterium]
MEHLKMQSPDIVSENMAYIAERWPECLTEEKDENGKLRPVIDFDKLRQLLSSDATGEGQERYQFTWPDKRHAIRLANTPTTDTLRPCREESVDFENTQNLYIEGDNLDVLKLLRESYLGKVKMIYIDPPYNTGGDFVYKDNFIKKNSDYAEVSGAYDEEGYQVVDEFEKNTDSNGRFHTDWLNMIYPRLKVARDLLTDDGVIFISIDDNEAENLKKLCNEVFGERNFIAQFEWRKKTGANDAKDIAVVTEYILLFSKNHSITIENQIWQRDKESINEERYKFEDEFIQQRGKFYYDTLDRGGLQYSDSMNFGIEAPDGALIYPNGRDSFENDGWIWKWSKDKVKWGLENKFLEFVKSNKSKGSSYTIKYKIYQNVDNEGKLREKSGRAFMNLILEPINQIGNSEMKSLFNGKTPFSNPKPVGLIKYLLNTTKHKDALILDFFSGSATTAHATMQQNADDGGKRKYICVQLPEETPEDSEARKAGYATIPEIAKERIRRAGKKIKEEHPDWNGDTGFRVLKLDNSNMENVFYTPAETTEQTLFNDNIKPDRTDEDLLFQVMMELGIALSDKIEKTMLAGKTVWNVGEGYLMACFEPNVNEETITAIAKQQPQYFVMADRSLANDNVADNFEQIFNEYSESTIRRII